MRGLVELLRTYWEQWIWFKVYNHLFLATYVSGDNDICVRLDPYTLDTNEEMVETTEELGDFFRKYCLHVPDDNEQVLKDVTIAIKTSLGFLDEEE